MDLQTQLQIPPPIQPDGFQAEPRIDGASPPPLPHAMQAQQQQHQQPHFGQHPQLGESAPHFELQPTGRIRTRLRKAHRRLSPLMIFVGYISSASIGIGLGVLILKYIGFIDANWNIR